MAIFTFLGGLISSALFGGALLATKLIAAGLALATQLAVSYLNRPKKRSYSAVQGQVQYGADVPAGTAFGMSKVKGQRVFYAKYGKGNKFNAEVFALANGWCDGLEPEIYFYGVKHTLIPRPIIGNEVAHYGVGDFGNLISIRFYDGRPGQGPDTKLVSDTANLGKIWKATSVGTGICYVVVERQWDEDKFKHGRPEFEFILRGLREYDPRFDSTADGSGPQRLNDPATWAWTENPAIHRLNYVLGVKGRVSGRTLIGMGKPISAIDLGSHIASANVCDAIRKGKKTYACSLYVQADDDHTEILREIEDAMAGYGMNRYGLSGVLAGAPQLPVMNIGPIDIRGDEGKQITPRKSAFELFNSLSGQFTSKESHWKPESLKTVTVNNDIATDGRRREGGNDFLQVTDPDIGQYLLNIRYRQQRKGGAIKLPVSRRAGLKAEIGSWVTFEGKTWLVTGRGFDGKLRFTLQLSETGADIYDDEDIEPGPIIIPPTPPVNPSLLTTVQDFTVEVGMVDGPDGYEVPALRFKWTPPDDPTIIAVRFEFFEGDNPTGKTVYTWRSDAPESGEELTSANVAPAARYTARATIVTVPDRFKTWTSWFTTVDYTGDIYYPGLIEEINEHTAEMLAPMNVNIRDLIETARNVAREALNQDAGQYLDRQSSLTKISSTYDNVTAEYRHLVEVATGPTSALGLRIETLELEMPGKADAAVLDQALIRIDDLDGEVTAQGLLISGVEAKVDGVSASGLFRTTVEATEAGALSTIGLSVAATADGPTSQAAMLMSARSGGKSMIGFLADMIYFRDTAGNFDPFVIEGGTAYFNNARIRNLTADSILAKSLDANEVLQDGTLITQLLAFDTVTARAIVEMPSQSLAWTGEGNWTTIDTLTFDNENPNPPLLNYRLAGSISLPVSGSVRTSRLIVRIRNTVDNSIVRTLTIQGTTSASTGTNYSGDTGSEFFIDFAIQQGNSTYVIEYSAYISSGSTGGYMWNLTTSRLALLCWKR